eukprot:135891-Chlamydomonas_euryale.AAC.1
MPSRNPGGVVPVLPMAVKRRASRPAMASPPPFHSCAGTSFGPGARPGFVVFIAALTSGTVTTGPPAC